MLRFSGVSPQKPWKTAPGASLFQRTALGERVEGGFMAEFGGASDVRRPNAVSGRTFDAHIDRA
jgi:hypothetical protein